MPGNSKNIPDRDAVHWYVIRCHNMVGARLRALLSSSGVEFFVPETIEIVTEKGRRVKKLVPVVRGLFFLRESYNSLYQKIHGDGFPMTFYFSRTTHVQDDAIWVTDTEMQRFMKASQCFDRNPEIKPFGEIALKAGDHVRVIDGPFAGCDGWLVQIRRGQRKRLVLTLANLMTVSIALQPEDLVEVVVDET